MNRKSQTKATLARAASPVRRIIAVLLLLSLSVQVNNVLADTASEASRKDFDYNFTIKDLEGNRIAMETLKGKVIFLNLWATWCGPCRWEMASIQALYEKVKNEKVVFIMLSIDTDENQKRVAAYMRDKRFTFKAYMPTGYLTEQLNVPSIPTTFIVSPDGKIARKEVGAQDFNTKSFENLLEKLAE